MRPSTTLVAILFFVVIGNQSHGQNQGFGNWGKILQGISGDRTPYQAPASQGMQGLPDMSGILGGLGGGNQNIGSSPNPLGGLQNLLGKGLQNLGANSGPTGQMGQTDLLSRMNQKSKNAIDRTTQWAQQKKQEMTSKMFSGAFDMLKPQASQGGQGNGLLQGASGALDWLKPSGNAPLNQPPIRAAENYGQQPSLRY
jgi:hypothetical protein